MKSKNYYRLLDLTTEISEIINEDTIDHIELRGTVDTLLISLLGKLKTTDVQNVRILIKALSRYGARID